MTKFNEVVVNLVAERPYVQFYNGDPHATENVYVTPAEVGGVIASHYEQLSRTTTMLIATDNGHHPTEARLFAIQGHFMEDQQPRPGMYLVQGFTDVPYSGVSVTGEKNNVLAGLATMPFPMVEGKADQVELRLSLKDLATNIPAVQANLANFPQHGKPY